RPGAHVGGPLEAPRAVALESGDRDLGPTDVDACDHSDAPAGVAVTRRRVIAIGPVIAPPTTTASAPAAHADATCSPVRNLPPATVAVPASTSAATRSRSGSSPSRRDSGV